MPKKGSFPQNVFNIPAANTEVPKSQLNVFPIVDKIVIILNFNYFSFIKPDKYKELCIAKLKTYFEFQI